jgi:D-3-phosphoglycerate dehydrogenase
MRVIGVITPIKHIPQVVTLLESKGSVVYLEQGSKQEVRNFLLDNEVTTLICNPNQQSFIIDKELLDGTQVNLINTCSTGLNHIDVEYCTLNEIEIYSLTKDLTLINDLPSTAELSFGLMLSLLRKIPQSREHI